MSWKTWCSGSVQRSPMWSRPSTRKGALMPALPDTIMVTPMSMTTDMPMEGEALYRLMTWLSPAYPVGAFCHSGGLEWAVEAQWVTDRASTQSWVESWLDHGGGWNG